MSIDSAIMFTESISPPLVDGTHGDQNTDGSVGGLVHDSEGAFTQTPPRVQTLLQQGRRPPPR